ncbi:MAG TPA: ATP-binding protein [Rhodocyclaceae bacterium]|nr:ATP-binding protein [Rhodocyclaceae bacterium]
MRRKKLPIGIQTFAKIREADYYYVDKTGIAVDLIDSGSHYFLSRPRRFGKSLFLDTLKELFEGNRALFRGLEAENRWDWSVNYPVLRLSFGGGVLGSVADLQQSLNEQLATLEEHYALPSEYPDARSRFKRLILRLAERSGQRVAVLVDEYDKPILDRIESPEIAREIREALKDVYSVIKDADAHVKFAFLTGVSKFSKVSVFSGLNNLEDLTLDARYGAICGYTENDVDTVFAAELPGLDREEIRRWYNGYNWLGALVYNPFDLLLLFRNRRFRAYWFETGTPTFLVKLLAERESFIPALGNLRADAELLSTFDVDNIPVEALMFQAGYLTIAGEEMQGEDILYRLRYPNREVRQSLHNSLLDVLVQSQRRRLDNRIQLYELLDADDLPGLRALFVAFYDSIPNDWYRNNPIANYEGYYASVFYSYFAALGLDIAVEDSSNKGRLDMAVRFQRRMYLFEFKVVELVPDGRALAQLQAGNYAAKYRAAGLPIYLIGVEFSKEQRTIVGFEVENVAPME